MEHPRYPALIIGTISGVNADELDHIRNLFPEVAGEIPVSLSDGLSEVAEVCLEDWFFTFRITKYRRGGMTLKPDLLQDLDGLERVVEFTIRPTTKK